MVNSISLEKDRFEAMMPFLDGKECKIIALCMDDAGMPNSSDDILGRARSLVAELNGIGIPTASIYVDPACSAHFHGFKQRNNGSGCGARHKG